MFDYEALATVIAAYKQDFQRIHKEEIYKWKAVKCFKDNWDETATDFPSMLNNALGRSRNLLASLNFYPKGMICQIAEKDSEAVRAMLIELFDESFPENLQERQ